jgi:sulfate permease, SulP family
MMKTVDHFMTRINRWQRIIQRTGALLGRTGNLDLLTARRTLRGYSLPIFKHDLRAGLNVAMLAFPQGMAYALIAGLPIQFGLFCFIGASFCAPWFASSRFNSYGPSNATSVLVLSSFLTLQLSPQEAAIAIPLVVLMAGLFLIAGAYLNVAKLIQYVSRTVITGYITAAALLIVANQVRTALGFKIEPTASFVGVAWNTAAALGKTHWPSLALAAVTGGILFLSGKYLRRLPTVALTLVLASLVGAWFAFAGYPVETLQSIRLGDWQFAAIGFSFDRVSLLASAALALALLITLEANSIGKSLAVRSGDRLNPSQEMLALGIGNVGSALVGGMPASASLTRSSLNFKSEAGSSLSNVIAASCVLGLLVAVSGAIQYIPKPALAVVVISIGLSLINRHQIQIVSRATRSDSIVFYTTTIAGLFLALDTCIYLGTAVSIVLFLRKVAEPEMVEYGFSEEGVLAELADRHKRSNPQVSIVHVEGELFFGAAEIFYEQLRRVCDDPRLKVVILKLRHAHHLDATSVMALEELYKYMREHDRILIVSEARKEAIRVFKRSGFLKVIGRDAIFPDNPSNPTLSTAKALRYALKLLKGQEADIKIFVGSSAASHPKP